MGNDNKVKSSKMSDEQKSSQIHKEVMLFLGGELDRIHHGASDQSYDIEKEYAKTKKQRSPFSMLMLAGCFIVVFTIAFFMTKVISAHNEEITVSLEEFDDLNLKNLLNTVGAAQANYDNAVKSRASIEGDMTVKLKAAEDTRKNDIFVIDSMNLRSKKDYAQRRGEAEKKYNEAVAAIHEEYDALLIQADREIEEYKKQLAEFDTAKIESAKEKEKALDSERRVKELEQKKIRDQYELRIFELNKKLADTQQRNSEEMRRAISSVSAQYQAEIDRLDPVLNDGEAKAIIAGTASVNNSDFDGTKSISMRNISSEKVSSAVSEYQKIYDAYKYLDKAVASIPQKNSIPSYVTASHKLVNTMGDTFVNTTLSFYNETVELNGKIASMNERISEHEGEMTEQKKLYEDTLENLMTLAKTNAVILEAGDYDSIRIYVSGKARYLISEAGTDAEFKVEKTSIKGKIFRMEDKSFRFEVSEDKDGNKTFISFEALASGTPVKILGK